MAAGYSLTSDLRVPSTRFVLEEANEVMMALEVGEIVGRAVLDVAGVS